MDGSKASPVAGIVLLVLDVVLIAGILTFAAPCPVHDGATPSSCLWASRAMLGAGAVLGVLAIVRIFERDEGERRGLSLGAALVGVLVAVTPGALIDLCSDPTMACHVTMRPFALCVGIAVALVGGADLTMRLVAVFRRG